MFESCLRNSVARHVGLLSFCYISTLHMLPVAVLSVASLGESGKAERESCLRNYKNASAFFFLLWQNSSHAFSSFFGTFSFEFCSFSWLFASFFVILQQIS